VRRERRGGRRGQVGAIDGATREYQPVRHEAMARATHAHQQFGLAGGAVAQHD
jgi:hypothetical protein